MYPNAFICRRLKIKSGQIDLKDKDGGGLTDYQKTGIIYKMDSSYIGKGHTMGRTYFRLKGNPAKKNMDGDRLTDGVDDRPLVDDTGLIAKLNNQFSGMNYLHIAGNDGAIYEGGQQNWWMDKAAYQEDSGGMDRVKKITTDKYYRLWKNGCGTIAMSDAELYMALQNKGHSLRYPVTYNKNTGLCTERDYREYVERMYDNIYVIGSDPISYVTGLTPWAMEKGLRNFLKTNNCASTNVKWARYRWKRKSSQKGAVLYDIKKMLKDNIPVVFAYYAFGKKKITLYSSLQDALNRVKEPNGINSHYMTVIGLYKFEDADAMEYKYILEVVSWGKIFYIDYNEYANKLSYFSNILSVY